MNLLNTLMFLGPIGLGELITIVIFIIIPLVALIDILKSEFKGSNKLIWFFVILFFNVLGALLYYFIGRKQKK